MLDGLDSALSASLSAKKQPLYEQLGNAYKQASEIRAFLGKKNKDHGSSNGLGVYRDVGAVSPKQKVRVERLREG